MPDEIDPVDFNDLSLPDKLFLYCAGALEATEQAEIRALLEASDPEAVAAFAEAQALLGQLPYVLDPVAPPEGVEEALLEQIRATESERTRSSVSTLHPGQRRGSSGANWGRALAWAAAILLFIGGSFAWVARDRDHAAMVERLALGVAEERAEADRYRSRIAELESASVAAARRIDGLQADLARSQESLLAQAERQEKSAGLNQATPERGPSDSELALQKEVRSLRDQLEQLEGLLVARANTASEEGSAASLASQEIDRLEGRLAASRAALELVRAPGVGIVDLFPPDEVGSASASVFWDRALRHCYLHVRALPTLKEADRYALWLEYENGAVVRVSDFEVDARGDAEFYEDLPLGKGEILRTFVTRENAASSVAPSDAIVLSELRVTDSDGGRRELRRRYRRRTL